MNQRKYILRGEGKDFIKKSYQNRKTRSFRATDKTWQYFQEKAESLDMSVGDYLELLATQNSGCSDEIERLKLKSMAIVYDDSVRDRDRGFVKRMFCKLFDIDCSYYPKRKSQYISGLRHEK